MTHARAHTGAARDYGKEQASTSPFCTAGSSERNEGDRKKTDRQGRKKKKKKERKGSCVRHRNTPNRTKTTHTKKKECVEVSSVTLYGCVAVWECVPFLNFFILLL